MCTYALNSTLKVKRVLADTVVVTHMCTWPAFECILLQSCMWSMSKTCGMDQTSRKTWGEESTLTK